MNSYFASVEQEMNPHLRGKPIAVVPLLTDTTCCIAVSYEGKAFGIKTGTMVADAKKLCPKMQFIEGDHTNYIRYHQKIIEVVESCIPIDSVRSIDEIACRLTGSQQEVAVAEKLATQIKKKIQSDVGSSLRCSIGVAPNRYLAKIAADMKKPDGFTVLRPCDLPGALYPLKLRDLPGVGAQMEARLSSQWIFTMEKLISLSVEKMREAWGSVVGEEMWHLLRGEELPEEVSQQKTIGHSHVLPPEMRNEEGAFRVLKKLVSKTAIRLRKEGFWATNLMIYVRFRGQDSWKARSKFTETQDTLVFMQAVRELWPELPPGSIFAVGIVLSGLVTDANHTPTLFDNPKREKLTQTLDRINEVFGKEAVHFGAIHESSDLAPLRIAFTRIPDEDEA